ncbi:MAG TPA: phosphomannomutase/phosphoglucomutase [Patescibacteria group bacterium]|nr:phosphomannomutase/phosphoglucomutase [Patescibacteria group bacterium]
MNIPQNIFKSYDIRGIYPEEINEENVYQITQSIYKVFLDMHNEPDKPLSVVIGRDMRLSSPSLFHIMQNALIDAGAKVIDIGLSSTPTFYFAVYHYGYDAGIQLSASHNPSQYNGFKMVKKSPQGLIKIGKSTGIERVKKYALDMLKIHSDQKGTIVKKDTVLSDELEETKKIADFTNLKNIKVVADAANAMGSLYIDALFKKLPLCQLIRMHFDLDGSFPNHQPDPLVKANLKSLQEKVLKEKADVGLAPDGDGDRLFFVDEKGQIIPASHITALVARELLKNNKNALIYFDIRYIRTAKKIIDESGGRSEITKVGHAFITEAMNKTHGLFAGESSGHYYFAFNGNAESQIPIITIVLSALAESGKPLSELVRSISRSEESGEYNFKTNHAEKILSSLKEKYHDGLLSTLDGISIDYPTWRFGVRTSNTEPLLRLNVESDTSELIKEKRDELIDFIIHLGAELHHD